MLSTYLLFSCVVLVFLLVSKFYHVANSLRSTVVHLDTRYPFLSLDPEFHKGRKFVVNRIGNDDFVCGDVSIKATRFTHLDVMTTHMGLHDFSRWSSLDQMWTLDSQMLRYLVQSKTSWLMGQCFIFQDLDIPDWAYDVCVGRSIGQFSKKTSNPIDFVSKRYNEIGFYDPYLDEIYANGTVVQHYTNGDYNRSARVIMSCGSSTSRRVNSIRQVNAQEYIINIEAPSFCDWRERALNQNSSTLHLDWLLQNLHGWCGEYPMDGLFTYKYCFPSSFMRFTGTFTAGVMNNSSGIVFIDQAKPFLKNTSTLEGTLHDSSQHLKIRRTTLRGISLDTSLKPIESVLGKPLEWLVLNITSNNVEMGERNNSSSIEASVFFYCSPDSLRKPMPRITRVRQTSSNTYEIFIVNPLVCCHPSLLPRASTLPETTVCYPARESLLKSTSSVFTNNAFYGEQIVESSHLSLPIQNLILENSVEKIFPYETFKRYRNSGSLLETFSVSEQKNLSTTPIGYFASGLYIRVRDVVSPKFFIGMPVKHQRFGVIGVILGWDANCRVPKQRRYEYELMYSNEHLNDPYYLIRVYNGVSTSPQEEKYLYSSQFLLEFVDITQLTEVNFKDDFLGAFDPNLKTFQISEQNIIADRSGKKSPDSFITLKTLYPQDAGFAKSFSHFK